MEVCGTRLLWLAGRFKVRKAGYFNHYREFSFKPARLFSCRPVLLGSDKGPNAIESVLQALTSCLSVGFSYNAAAMGISINSLEFDVEGNLDLHGFLGLSDTIRPGANNVRLTYRIDCDAPPAKVDELAAHVQKTSPVMDILRNPVEVILNASR